MNVSAGAIYLFESLVNPTLATGNTYWIALRTTSPTPVFWHYNDQGLTGVTVREAPGSAWETIPLATPAFDVYAGVPEPGTLALLATGLLGVAAGALRRRRRWDA